MAKATISSIVSRLDTVTNDLRALQAKMRELRTATREMQNFGEEIRQAVERQDILWLMNWQQRMRELEQRYQTAEAEFAELLQ